MIAAAGLGRSAGLGERGYSELLPVLQRGGPEVGNIAGQESGGSE